MKFSEFIDEIKHIEKRNEILGERIENANKRLELTLKDLKNLISDKI